MYFDVIHINHNYLIPINGKRLIKKAQVANCPIQIPNAVSLQNCEPAIHDFLEKIVMQSNVSKSEYKPMINIGLVGYQGFDRYANCECFIEIYVFKNVNYYKDIQYQLKDTQYIDGVQKVKEYRYLGVAIVYDLFNNHKFFRSQAFPIEYDDIHNYSALINKCIKETGIDIEKKISH